MILGNEEKIFHNQGFGSPDFSGLNGGTSPGVMVGANVGLQQTSPGLGMDYNSIHMNMNSHSQGIANHPEMYNNPNNITQINNSGLKGCTLNGMNQPQQQQALGGGGFMNHDPISPTFPPQNIDIPDISSDPFGQDKVNHSVYQNGIMSYQNPYQSHYNQGGLFNQALQQQQMGMMPNNVPSNQGLMSLHMMSQHQLNHTGNVEGMNTLHTATNNSLMSRTQSSPVRSNTTSPGRESSEESDDSLQKNNMGLKRPADQMSVGLGGMGINQSMVARHIALTAANNASMVNNSTPQPPKKQKTPKKRKKKDPNEPHKPVSAYALFFRDTQAAIKGQNPNASFGEVSKIVASMWDSLDVDSKHMYKKRTEIAKKEYLKQLAAYRASIVSKQTVCDTSNTMDPFATSPVTNNQTTGGLTTPNPTPISTSPSGQEKPTQGISPPRQMYSPTQFPIPTSSPSGNGPIPGGNSTVSTSGVSQQAYSSSSNTGSISSPPMGHSGLSSPMTMMSASNMNQMNSPQHSNGLSMVGPMGNMNSMVPPMGYSITSPSHQPRTMSPPELPAQSRASVPMINGGNLNCGQQVNPGVYNTGCLPSQPTPTGTAINVSSALNSSPGQRQCSRAGCHNPVLDPSSNVDSPPFCSNECMALHCR